MMDGGTVRNMFYYKNKFEELMHLVGFIISIAAWGVGCDLDSTNLQYRHVTGCCVCVWVCVCVCV